ncbi:MAG: ABC transporter substrate-binding protein [Acidimicrobiia bacterium]
MDRQRTRQWRWWLIPLLAAALLAGACGGDDGGGDTAGSDTATEAGGADGGAPAAKPTGEPIKVMNEAPIDTNATPYPNIKEAAQIYAKWINDNGGIKGRPLEVIFCDDRNDANEAGNCARKAVEEQVIANVGSFTIDVSRGIPIYEEASIAWFGACCPIVAQENTSKISFPMGFVNGFNTAAAIKMIEDECKSVVDVYGDLPVADVFHEAFANGWKSAGGDVSKLKTVRIPLAPGDYSAEAAKMTSPEVDCLWGNIGEANWPSLITALNSTGVLPRLYGPQGNLNSKVAEQFPAETDGGRVMNVYPNIAAPVWEDYRNALEQYDAPDLDWNSLAGLGTWTAFTAFTQIVESMEGDITAESFLEAASNTSSLDTGGMVGVLDFTKEWDGGGGNFPRIFNRTIFFDEIKDGKLEPSTDDPIDVTAAFDGKAS